MKIIELKPLLKPIQARIKIPGSKSYTNRALLIAALSGSKVKIINPLISDDTSAMIECLKKIKRSRSSKLDCNLSGITIRFMLALSAITKGTQILYGKEGLNNRPIGELVDALTQLGAKIEYLNKKGYPPVRVSSSKLNPGTTKINGSVSSQFISSILMVAPVIGEITIKIIGKQVSKPYIDMTIDIMKKFGVKVKNDNYKKYHASAGQKYSAEKYVVEGDLSSASYFAAIAVLTKSTITLMNINPNSKQADMRFIKILQSMGNKVVFGKDQITIQGKTIRPITINMEDCPDQIQTLAILASFAKGVTKISRIQSLRIKETDRIFALTNELKNMGIRTSVTKDTLTIFGGNPKSAQIETYGDHRMAMAFAVAGSKLPGMQIKNPDVVNKTFPDFWKKLDSIGIKNRITHSKNIVLIGMRGSGKTTVAKLLAQILNKQYIETDELIAKKIGLTISEIVAKYGWTFFRNKESEVVQAISLRNDAIISTGGGVVTREENIRALRQNGLLIFLNASLETLAKRVGQKIGHDPKMPSLTNRKSSKSEIEYILRQREKLYRQAADKIIETDNLKSKDIANLALLAAKENL